ncbi:MAG: 4Fe-4S dicluster domain-containing protein [Phycisphaerales bacterium]|nr:MAG: 4Fe-4S dicluster domain-containing protein [Phycisphaerales bacterium]
MHSVTVEIPDDEYWRRQIKCQYACPVYTDARGYVRAIARGDFESAYLIARGPNPLASICGRVCGAPCEAACRRGAVDQAVSIRALKRFVTERFGPESFTQETLKPISLLQRVLSHRHQRECSGLEEVASLRERLHLSGGGGVGRKVAIVGSGPAGLACAHDLALLGYRPVVYEMEPVPAGMLAVGIPEYRLPRDLIRAEVEVIEALGVEFVCNTQVGRDVTLARLRAEHEATVIAVGAKRSRKIPIPGGDGPGVLGGVEFLRDVALNNRSPASTLHQLGGRVVVIGGGNVAYDVSRTVIRQVGYDVSRSVLRQAQVREVHLCCLESVDEMPADDVEILEGHEEGVLLHPSRGPVELVRDASGRLTGGRFKKCLRVFDENRRFAPQFDESDVITLDADTVIWAIGQQPDLSFIDPAGDVRLTERGLIDCDADTLRTTAADVFVAGDIAYGPRLLIDAVASGKKCARVIHSHLSGQRLETSSTLVHLNLPDYEREQDYEKLPRTGIPTVAAADRRSDQRVTVERGYDERLAVTEACRCLDCGVNTIFDSQKCILCGGCADVCPELCLQLVSSDRLEGGDELAALLRTRYGEGADLSEASAIIKDEEKCIRCALCEQRCPVGAITMERVQFSSCWTAGAEPAAAQR